MRLIIAGGRDFLDYNRLEYVLGKLLGNSKPDAIVCGMAKGADALGRSWALNNGIDVIEMPADWDAYGKGAGYIRNKEMAKIATHCICFWDGNSRGTKHMIDLAKEFNLNLRVVNY